MSEHITEYTVRELIAEVLNQAVDDWKALNYGEFRETMFCSEVIQRLELVSFFHSKDFDAMARYVGVNPINARAALKVPDLDDPRLKERGKVTWRWKT